MEYQSLYRKYRPKNFDSLVGQEIVLKILKNAITQQKISHAYLFAGPRGTGKTTIARILARAINCELPNNGNLCDKCKACETSNQKENIDILEIDAASNNGVSEIRELRNKINLVPSTLNYKVYIIDEVHMLSREAFPALLKTLEEPPKHAIFILATTELHEVPTTILSRCQLLEFKQISNTNLKKRLSEISTEEQINIEEEALEEICKIVNGGMRDAIGILEKASLYANNLITSEDIRKINGSISESKIKELVDLINDSNIELLITKVEEYYNGGIDLIRLANEIIQYLRDDIFKRKSTETNKISNRIEELNTSINKMRISTNPKPIFEITLLKMCGEKVENMVSIKEETTFPQEKTTEKENNPHLVEEQKQKEVPKEEPIDKYKELKKIRVHNTLSAADKNIITEIREKWQLLRNEAFNTNYGAFARILFDDARPVAASEEYLIMTFKIESLATQCNDSMEKIEELIQNCLEKNHKIISLNEEEWKDYIEDYKKNKEKYVYTKEQEPEKIKNTQEIPETTQEKSLKDKALELFGEL